MPFEKFENIIIMLYIDAIKETLIIAGLSSSAIITVFNEIEERTSMESRR